MITVSPSGRTHFFAVLGGKLIAGTSGAEAAFKLAVFTIIPKRIPVILMRYTNRCYDCLPSRASGDPLVMATWARANQALAAATRPPSPERMVSRMLLRNRKHL